MAKPKTKSAVKGGVAKGKSSTVSTAPRGKIAAAPTKSSKAHARRVQDESANDDHDDDEEEIQSIGEIDHIDKHAQRMSESQEAPELVGSAFLETQQKDEMAELKKRLENKRLSKLKKTMTSRVSQFDEMYAKGLEELEQVEQSSGEKKLQQMFNVFKTFLDDATRKPEEKPKDLMEILEPLESASKEVGTACYKFAKRDLAAKGEVLAKTRELTNSRPKRFAESAQDIAHYVTEELHQMQQKNEDRLDARKFLKEHFKMLAKYSGSA